MLSHSQGLLTKFVVNLVDLGVLARLLGHSLVPERHQCIKLVDWELLEVLFLILFGAVTDFWRLEQATESSRTGCSKASTLLLLNRAVLRRIPRLVADFLITLRQPRPLLLLLAREV